MAIKKCGQTSITKLITLIKEALTGKANSNHSHGNLTNDGKIGTTANLPLFTGSAGIVSTKTAADARTSLEAMGIGSGNGAVGTKYTTTIEPDTVDKKTSSVKIIDNASGIVRAAIAIKEDPNNAENETSHLILRNNSINGRISIQSNNIGKKGLRIIDENGVTRVDISHNTNGDTCEFRINDASGNDVTCEVIGATPLKQWKDNSEVGVDLNNYIESGIHVFSNVVDANGDYKVSNLPENITFDAYDTILLLIGQFTRESDSNIRTVIQFLTSTPGSFYRYGVYVTDRGADPYYEFVPWIKLLDQYTAPRDIGAIASRNAALTLTASGWSNNQQTITTPMYLTAGTKIADIIVSPAPESMSACINSTVYCSEQGSNSLTFKCATVPSEDITMNILVLV